MGLEMIEHVVVVMMENRSFDNLLGWLYSPGNPAPVNIPPQTPTIYSGLSPNTYANQLDNSSPPVYASRPPTAWPTAANPNLVPTPDPHEEFDDITNQIFGSSTPAAGAVADMSGFLKDYATTAAGTASAGQIMQSYGPPEANVINQLARNFAVCDRWFASAPSQTWPNRGFVHTGSSDGHINNDDYEPYDIETIFNVLEGQGKSWGVFHNTTLIPSLTWIQFLPRLGSLADHFQRYDSFKKLCSAADMAAPAQKLPAYSFIEPRFTPELGLFKVDYPEDYHPPHNVCRGEQFLADVYQAVRSSPYRDKILLVITFDEHGGCYDHVPPPIGAAAPQPGSVSRDGQFDFSRYGVRVPTIVISSYVQPGTVFRANEAAEKPFDHTSILATLRDWLVLDANPQAPFLPSPRIKSAPTLDRVLTLAEQNKTMNWPAIVATCSVDGSDESLDTPLNDVQRSLLAGAVREFTGNADMKATADKARSLVSYRHALDFLHP